MIRLGLLAAIAGYCFFNYGKVFAFLGTLLTWGATALFAVAVLGIIALLLYCLPKAVRASLRHVSGQWNRATRLPGKILLGGWAAISLACVWIFPIMIIIDSLVK